MANKILLNLLLLKAATVVNGNNYNFYRSRVVNSNSRIVPGFSEYISSLLTSGPTNLRSPNAQISPSQCRSFSRQGLQYTWCYNSPSYNSKFGLSYDAQLPSYDSLLPSYDALLPTHKSPLLSYDAQLSSYGAQSQSYGAKSQSQSYGAQSQSPSYGAQSQSPSYGVQSQSPSYGVQSQSPSYGAQSQSQSYGAQSQSPSYGAQSQSPSYGAQSQSPSYGVQSQSPSYGAQPQSPYYDAQSQSPSYGVQSQSPSYGAQPQSPYYDAQSQSPSYGVQSQSPSYGAQPQSPYYDAQSQSPSYGVQSQSSSYGAQSQSPSYDSQSSYYGSQLPLYGAQLPSYDSQLSSYGAQLSSYHSQSPSYNAQLSSYDSQSPSNDAQLSSYHSQSPSYNAQLSSYDSQSPSNDAQLPSYDSQSTSYYLQHAKDYSPQHSPYSPEYGSQSSYGLSQLPGSFRPNYDSQYSFNRLNEPSSVSHHHHHYQHLHGIRPHNYNHKPKYPLKPYDEDHFYGLHQYNYNQKPKHPLGDFNDNQDYSDGKEYHKGDNSGKKHRVVDSYNKYENTGLQINNVSPFPSGSKLHIKSSSYPSYKSRSENPLALVIALPRIGNDISKPVARGETLNITEALDDYEIDHHDYRGESDVIDIVGGAILDGLSLDFLDIEHSYNYLSLIYSVHRLAEFGYHEQCTGSNIPLLAPDYDERRYNAILLPVSQGATNATVLEQMFDEIYVRTLEGAADLWVIIADAKRTNSACETNPEESNQYIRGIIKKSTDREKLISQGRILKYVAAFAKYYYENYHDEFIKVASGKYETTEYLRLSQEKLVDLARKLVEYKTGTGKDCNYQIGTEYSTDTE